MLIEHEEKESDTEKESERVVNMVRSITDKIIDNVYVSTEDEDTNTTSDLKRVHSLSPRKKRHPSKREKKDEPTDKLKISGESQLSVELANIEQGAKLLQEDLTVLKENNTKLKIEAGERDEDVRLLKDEIVSLKKENQESKDKIKKAEKDAKEVVMKVSESLRVDIDKKKEEVEGAWKEYNKLKKDDDEKYKLLVEENVKISQEMAKLQKERDLAEAKVETLEVIVKAKKYESNLKKFKDNFPAGCSSYTKDDAGETVDECIKSSKCIGNCKHLELDHVKRLKELKDSGSIRSSPQAETQPKPNIKVNFKCKHCDFNSENKSELESHIKIKHICNCKMCGGTGKNMTSMDVHFQNFHEQRETSTQSMRILTAR